jgi:hypothetical protein
LGKELGFKSGTEFRQWLLRNKIDHYISQGMRAIQAEYIPEEFILPIKRFFANNRNSQRQLLLGEA